MRPYETESSRIQALYRMLMASPRSRTLELCLHEESIAGRLPWPGDFLCTCLLNAQTSRPPGIGVSDGRHFFCRAEHSKTLPFTSEAFDLVILHGSLDRMAAARTAGDVHAVSDIFLREIYRLVAPGGVVAGCITNRSILRAFLNLNRRLVRRGAVTAKSSNAGFSYRTCEELLSGAGFSEIYVLSLLKNSNSNIDLVSTNPKVSRLAYRGMLGSLKHALSPAGYWVRRVVVDLGLNRFLAESIFFWGHKPC